MPPEVQPPQSGSPSPTPPASTPTPTPSGSTPADTAAPSQPTTLKSVSPSPTAASTSWQQIRRRGRNYGWVAAFVLTLIVLGGVGGALLTVGLRSSKIPTSKTAAPVVQTLSDEQIKKLGQTTNQLGDANQTLTIGANSIFTGKVNVASDLSLGGKLNANGPVALSDLSISGATTLNNLSVAKSLQISGLTNAQNGLSVKGTSSFAGDLAVSGTTSVGSLTAGSVAAKQLQVSGPLSITHLISGGAPVSVVGGSSLGSGGSVSVSGNDTAGTVSAAFGSGGTGGTIATVTFRSAYGSGVHVILSPTSQAAAQAQYYVTRTQTGFSIGVVAPVSGPMSFDYLVVQ